MPKPKDIPMKKCPFCGNEAVLKMAYSHVVKVMTFTGWYIRCKTKGCIRFPSTYRNTVQAKFDWNTRATATTKRSK